MNFFLVWARYAGLKLSGEINTTDARYLCEKHFTSNYINTQSRRKMLVHTAIPIKWKPEIDLEIDENERTDFTIVQKESPSKTRNTPYKLKRKNDDSIKIQNISIESECSTPTALVAKRKIQKMSNLQETAYEQITIPEGNEKKRMTYIVVKSNHLNNQKVTNSNPKKIINYLEPSASSTLKDEETFFVTNEGNIASTGTNQEVKIPEISSPSPSVPQQLENYTEFIFNGEMYAQMPKRVFDAERERIKAEVLEEYKKMIKSTKHQIDMAFNRLIN